MGRIEAHAHVHRNLASLLRMVLKHLARLPTLMRHC